MNDLRKAAQQALEALENCRIEYDYHGNPADEENKNLLEAGTALRAALAQPERKPLTLQEVDEIWFTKTDMESVVRAVERAHGIGGEE